MSEEQTNTIVEHLSPVDFEATLDRLTAAISKAGLSLFNRFDHDAGARDVGLEMPKTTVLFYGNPKGGTPLMLAAPLAALDLPLRVLVHVPPDGQTAIAFHPIDAVMRQAGVPDAIAEKLLPAQHLLVNALVA